MKRIVLESSEAVDEFVAHRIAFVILHRRTAVLSLATGDTTRDIFRRFVELKERLDIDCRGVNVFAVDEYLGLSESSEVSCRRRLREQLTAGCSIPEEQLHAPTDARFVPRTVSQGGKPLYDQLVAQLGGVDFQLLGVGQNGHVGFNQPGAPFGLLTHTVRLSEETRAALSEKSRRNGHKGDVPEAGVTMGIESLMQSREIMLVAKGAAKRDVARRLAHGPVTEDLPASVLRLHPAFTLVLDREAAEPIEP